MDKTCELQGKLSGHTKITGIRKKKDHICWIDVCKKDSVLHWSGKCQQELLRDLNAIQLVEEQI